MTKVSRNNSSYNRIFNSIPSVFCYTSSPSYFPFNELATTSWQYLRSDHLLHPALSVNGPRRAGGNVLSSAVTHKDNEGSALNKLEHMLKPSDIQQAPVDILMPACQQCMTCVVGRLQRRLKVHMRLGFSAKCEEITGEHLNNGASSLEISIRCSELILWLHVSPYCIFFNIVILQYLFHTTEVKHWCMTDHKVVPHKPMWLVYPISFFPLSLLFT